MSIRASCWWNRLKPRLGARAGTAAIETALLAPIVLLLLAGSVEYGRAITERMPLESAVRAGLHYATKSGATTANVEDVVRASIADEVEIAVEALVVCECPDGSSVSCAGKCAVGSRRTFTRIEASRSHTALVSWPGIETPAAFQVIAQVRTQ